MHPYTAPHCTQTCVYTLTRIQRNAQKPMVKSNIEQERRKKNPADIMGTIYDRKIKSHLVFWIRCPPVSYVNVGPMC